jgi:hypothetical protein
MPDDMPQTDLAFSQSQNKKLTAELPVALPAPANLTNTDSRIERGSRTKSIV